MNKKILVCFVSILCALSGLAYADSNLGDTNCVWDHNDVVVSATGAVVSHYQQPTVLHAGLDIDFFIQKSVMSLQVSLELQDPPYVAFETCDVTLGMDGYRCFAHNRDDGFNDFNVYVAEPLFNGTKQGNVIVAAYGVGTPGGEIIEDNYSCK